YAHTIISPISTMWMPPDIIHAGTCRFHTRSRRSSAAMSAWRIATIGAGALATGCPLFSYAALDTFMLPSDTNILPCVGFDAGKIGGLFLQRGLDLSPRQPILPAEPPHGARRHDHRHSNQNEHADHRGD